jgi:hypothetical protein
VGEEMFGMNVTEECRVGMYDLLLYKRNTVSNTNAGTKESGGCVAGADSRREALKFKLSKRT